MNARIPLSVALIVCAAITAFVEACSADQPIPACRDIPEGGCPLQGGVACDDPSCAAAYACGADGGWVLARTCPARDGSVQDANIEATSSDAGYDVDAPPGAFGGPGCIALQSPDCPLGTALVCSSGCCGCEDLYVCSDGGWNPWGMCSDDAGLTKL